MLLASWLNQCGQAGNFDPCFFFLAMNGRRWEESSETSTSSSDSDSDSDISVVERLTEEQVEYVEIGEKFLKQSNLSKWFANWPSKTAFTYGSDCVLSFSLFIFSCLFEYWGVQNCSDFFTLTSQLPMWGLLQRFWSRSPASCSTTFV